MPFYVKFTHTAGIGSHTAQYAADTAGCLFMRRDNAAGYAADTAGIPYYIRRDKPPPANHHQKIFFKIPPKFNKNHLTKCLTMSYTIHSKT